MLFPEISVPCKRISSLQTLLLLLTLFAAFLEGKTNLLSKNNRIPSPSIWNTTSQLNVRGRGSGLNARCILQSPAGRFAFGFFSTTMPGAYILAIYLYPLKTVLHRQRVWYASNSNNLPIKLQENSSLHLHPENGLILYDSNGIPVWSSKTISAVSHSMELREDGNLLLYDEIGFRSVWESFDHPVNVLLTGQKLRPGMALVSGSYRLSMEIGGLVVLYNESSQIWRLRCKWDSAMHAQLTLTPIGMLLVQELHRTKSNECSADFNGRAVALSLSNVGDLHIDYESPLNAQSSARRKPCQLSGEHTHCCICCETNCRTINQQFYGRRILSSSQTFYTSSMTRKNSVVFGGLFIAVILAILAAVCVQKKPQRNTQKKIPHVLPESIPQKLSYQNVRKMTGNFSKQLGDGGFGGVYEGVLKDGRKVAVKVLERASTQGEKEFKAEMVTMASIRHMNIVQLRGYCAEKHHRMLVYEFMSNSSLDKWLFSPSGKGGILDWGKRFTIAVGTARGLAYLHEECNQQIIHLDVKPENILLDDNFTAKVADFGLSKLIDRDKSKVTTNMRGTPGYLAPEWMNKSSVTTKADVYSFGMVLLELICGRETIDLTKGSEQWYLPAWAVRLVEEGRTLELVDGQLYEEIEYFYGEDAKRSIRTALCCIQEDPVQRPKMSKVVQMLDGVVEPKLPQLSRLPLQPSTAASRIKDRLAEIAEVLRTEQGSFYPSDDANAGHELSFNAWGLNNTSVAGQAHTVLKARNQPCIPPWPLKEDIVLIRGSGKGSEYSHAVIRDVKVRTQQVRLALLMKLDEGEKTWVVSEEESIWRQWSVMLRTLEFWVATKWITIPGYGPRKFPIEWTAN